MNPDYIEIGPAVHPRNGQPGILYRHARTGVYVLKVGHTMRGFPPTDGAHIEYGSSEPGQAGRPSLYGEPMRSFPLKLTEDQRVYILDHGGASYIRQLIDQDRGVLPDTTGNDH